MLISMTELRFNTFGKRVRILREDMGLSQSDLAERVEASGVHLRQTYLSELERTGKTPTGEIVAGIAKALNTTTDYLLLMNDDPAPQRSVEEQLLAQARTEKERELFEELIELIKGMPPEQQQLALDAVELIRRAGRSR
jgi:transcriptional regulator with XRE-family HTH domain